MPWNPELFSAPVLERIRSQTRHARASVPYFEGLMSGETEALVGSFAGVPELHHPVAGRVRGRRAFERFVAQTSAWLRERNAAFGEIDRIVSPARGVEEIVMTLDGQGGRVELPVAVVAERDDHARIVELRVYFSTWPTAGNHATRPPLLQEDARVQMPGVFGDYARALAAGDVEAVLRTFEPDAYVREPAGSIYVHRGHDELRALYERFFSGGGGIVLEHCTHTDDDHACALEYNLVRWGRTELRPEAGLAVYVRGANGKLASARIYDDADPPVGH